MRYPSLPDTPLELLEFIATHFDGRYYPSDSAPLFYPTAYHGSVNLRGPSRQNFHRFLLRRGWTQDHTDHSMQGDESYVFSHPDYAHVIYSDTDWVHERNYAVDLKK